MRLLVAAAVIVGITAIFVMAACRKIDELNEAERRAADRSWLGNGAVRPQGEPSRPRPV